MDKWSVVIDKSPWLEMLKNIIGSEARARALGSWQSIQIACHLQESVREDTGRRVLYVVRIQLTARSDILVSWSVYPNYEYHYFSMYLVHLWLVEITCRLECISATVKLSPGRQMRPIKWSGDPDIPNYRSDWRIEKFSCQSPCPNFWLSKYTVLVSIFLVGQPKIIADHPGYHLGGPLGDPGFFVSCSIGACMINVSEWHKFGIAIVTIVFPEPGHCCQARLTTKLHQLTEVSLVQLLRRRI